MNIIGSKNLPSVKAKAIQSVNTEAEIQRTSFVPSTGQAFVYLAKVTEAKLFVSQYDNTTYTKATATDWPYLSAEIGLTAANLYDVAKAIITANVNNNLALSKIEYSRLNAKSKINHAKNLTEIEEAKNVTWNVTN